MKVETIGLVQAKNLLEQAWWAGVKAVNGYDRVKTELIQYKGSPITHVLSVGKAASAMMLAAYDSLPEFEGLCVTKYAHTEKRLKDTSSIKIIESGHPVPDQNSLLAGQMAYDFVNSMSSLDHLLMLVSGGASALVEMLPSSMNLDDLKQLTAKMLSSQKTIHQINKTRSDISLIKNGKLLNTCPANRVTTLAISDVKGDNLSVIGSGIGACSLPDFNYQIICSNKLARDAVVDFFDSRHINIVCNEEALYGDVYDVAESLSQILIQAKPGAFVFGGEPVIQLPENPGKGGRNQALSLMIAKEIAQNQAIVILVAGTDGTDGSTDSAGGIVDGQTFSGHEAELAIQHANSGDFLEKVNALFMTGPTGTNVMDLAIALKLKE